MENAFGIAHLSQVFLNRLCCKEMNSNTRLNFIMVNSYNLYSAYIIIRVIISKRMRWTGLVARIGGMRHPYKILVKTRRKGRNHFENLCVDGTIILKKVLK
jgi:hypothetical protein